MSQPSRILIVDDDNEMRSALTEALSRSGFEVEASPDGESALSLFETGSFDLVVSDIRMPRKTGFELLAQINNSSSPIPVILITAYGDDNSAQEALDKGAADFLLKPFSIDTLEKSINNLSIKEPTSTGSAIIPKPTMPAKRQKPKREIVTKNPKMLELLDIIERTAKSRASALIQGESGTGKELVARHIHEKSDRSSGPFIAVNCAALPESLLESELFGHEKGAFTGAIARKLGKFELADGGTILLDEITEMQIELQAKLLRVLQEKEIDRVGGSSSVAVDVRVVATTNLNVQKAIKDGKFREDLYFRLNVIPLMIPPLRERKDDIPFLANFFLKKFLGESGGNVKRISKEAMDVLSNFRWRGNVRELENVLERASLLTRGEEITPQDLFLMQTDTNGDDAEKETFKFSGTLEEMERKMILGALTETGDNRTKAAERLGISIRTLRNKLHSYKEVKL